MVRRLLFSTAFLAIGFMVSSCGKKEEAILLSNSSLAGNWMLVATVAHNSTKETASAENTSNMFVFDGGASGSYVRFFYNSKDAISYSVPDTSSLTINYGGSSAPQTSKIESFDGENLIMLDNNPAISTIAKRRYQRVSEDKKTQLFVKYNIK